MDISDQLNKGEIIQRLLDTEGRIMLCIDATYTSVDVPSRFKNDTSLMLILNSKMPNPINVEKDHIHSELRFGGIPHYCNIPFDAIWSAFNPDTNHGMMWPESMPEEVLKQHGFSQLNELKPPPPQPAPPKKSRKTKKVEKKLESGPSPFQVIEGGGKNLVKKPQKKASLKLVE
jgi:stringent starvation protein B